MSEKLKEFYKKIHDNKNNIPEYASIVIRPGQKLVDIKIKKEASNILRRIAHDQKTPGWFLHSVHIPIKNLGLPPDAKNKEIIAYFDEPRLITRDKDTKEYVEELLRKYISILPDKKNHFFSTKRFKKKKDLRTGATLKGF
ncbi:MAG: hypothetical protein JW891_05365 [Candidatus Lokiarchaeota archaeon]|nr:hypothetical protein [Candidatus Lokiarchaeota archaeon]